MKVRTPCQQEAFIWRARREQVATGASAHKHDIGTGDTLYWLTGVTEGDLGAKASIHQFLTTVSLLYISSSGSLTC